MATFKVGQRVRLISQDPSSIARWGNYIGQEAIVVATSHPHFSWALGIQFLSEQQLWAAMPRHLAPLTDPKADEFIEGLKKLAREPAPLVPQKVAQ